MNSRLLASLFVASLFLFTDAYAGEVTFHFTAVVTESDIDEYSTGVQVGDTIAGYYTFDTTASPFNTTTDYVDYGNLLSSFSLSIGNVEFERRPPSAIGVANSILLADDNSAGFDKYRAYSDIRLVNLASANCTADDYSYADLELYAYSPSTLVTSTSLSAVAPDVSLADHSKVLFVSANCFDSGLGYNRSLEVIGEITSIIGPSADEQLEDLTSLVVDININAGISNSLDGKLESAISALDDTNENNDVAALNSMYSFCNSVNAQRGKKLTEDQADQLIAAANSVIVTLDEIATPCD